MGLANEQKQWAAGFVGQEAQTVVVGEITKWEADGDAVRFTVTAPDGSTGTYLATPPPTDKQLRDREAAREAAEAEERRQAEERAAAVEAEMRAAEEMRMEEFRRNLTEVVREVVRDEYEQAIADAAAAAEAENGPPGKK